MSASRSTADPGSGRPPVDAPDLAARRPAGDAARPRCSGVVGRAGCRARGRDALPARHGARLPGRRGAAPGRRQLRQRPLRLPPRRRHAPIAHGAAAGRRGRASSRSASWRSRSGSSIGAGRRRRALAGVRRRARSCSCSGVLARRRGAGVHRGPVAVRLSRRWARCSCSCSSGWSRWSGRRTCRRGRLDPLFFAAAIPPGALITAILVVNNLRDIPTDAAAGKRTLAVVLGRATDAGRVRRAAGRGVRGAGAARGVGARRRPAASRRAGCRAAAAAHAAARRAAGADASDGSASRASSTWCSRGPRGWRSSSRCCSRSGSRSAVWRRAVTHDRDPRARRRPGDRPVPAAVRDGGRHVGRPRGVDLAAGRRRRTDGRGRGGRRARRRRGRGERARRRWSATRSRWLGGPAADGRGARAARAAGPGARGLRSTPRGSTSRAPTRSCGADGDGVGVNATIPLLGPAASAEAAQQSVGAGFRRSSSRAGPSARPTSSSTGSAPSARRSARTSPAARRQRRLGSADRRGPARGASARSTSSTSSSRWPGTTSRRWPSSGGGSGCRSPPTRRSRRCEAARELLDADAVDVLVVKPARVGGPVVGAEIAELAAERGVPVVVSTLFETGVGIAAALAMAAALPEVEGAREGSTTAWRRPACSSTTCCAASWSSRTGGCGFPIAPGPGGLGIEIDAGRVDRYRAEAVEALRMSGDDATAPRHGLRRSTRDGDLVAELDRRCDELADRLRSAGVPRATRGRARWIPDPRRRGRGPRDRRARGAPSPRRCPTAGPRRRRPRSSRSSIPSLVAPAA